MSTDATQVSGSPLSGEGPRPGDVLAERYELLELIEADEAGNRVIGETILEDARDCFVHSEDRLVSLVGVSDLLLVDTPDALLVPPLPVMPTMTMGSGQDFDAGSARRLSDDAGPGGSVQREKFLRSGGTGLLAVVCVGVWTHWRHPQFSLHILKGAHR